MSELESYLSDETMPSVEELLTENVEQKEMIQHLLSEKSELQQIMQEQQLIVQEMQGEIMKRNNSDLQLKEDELKFKQGRENLVEAQRIAKATTENAKSNQERYEIKANKIAIKEEYADKRIKEANTIIQNQNKILEEKAMKLTVNTRTYMEQKYKDNEKKLKKSYKIKKYKLYTITLGGLIYGIYVTLLTAIRSNSFKTDIKTFFNEMGNVARLLWEKVHVVANIASGACKKIPNESVGTIVGLIIYWFIVILISVIIFVGLGWCIYKFYLFYKKKFSDATSVVIVLVSFALMVWFGDYIGRAIEWDLIILFLLIQVAYMGGRMLIKKEH